MSDDLHVRYSDRLDTLDEQIWLAEKSGNLSERVALLRERAQLWFELAEELQTLDRDSTGAFLGGQRDLANASLLSRDAL